MEPCDRGGVGALGTVGVVGTVDAMGAMGPWGLRGGGVVMEEDGNRRRLCT